MSLLNVLLNNLNNPSITLNLDEIKYVQGLLQTNPEVFDKITDTVNNIMSDGKIDLHDLPKLLLLITQIYNSNLIHSLLNNVDIINIIQYTIDSLLSSDLLPLPNIEVKTIKSIIDTSINLLRLNIIPIENEVSNCFSLCFPK